MVYTATKFQLVVEIYTKFYLFSVYKYITLTPPYLLFFACLVFGIHPFVESHSPMCLRSHLYFNFHALFVVSFTCKISVFILVLLCLSVTVYLFSVKSDLQGQVEMLGKIVSHTDVQLQTGDEKSLATSSS